MIVPFIVGFEVVAVVVDIVSCLRTVHVLGVVVAVFVVVYHVVVVVINVVVHILYVVFVTLLVFVDILYAVLFPKFANIVLSGDFIYWLTSEQSMDLLRCVHISLDSRVGLLALVYRFGRRSARVA